MKGIGAVLALSATTAMASVIGSRDSLPTVSVKGNAFFAGGSRFYIRGVDYQPGGSSKLEDPIAEPDICQRDIAEFKKLGINTVRIYSVDNSANHDTCMQALSDAGIYLVLDVNTPKYSLRRDKPHQSYNDVYLQNVFATIDMFAKYDNTLAFFSGNEVINDATTTPAAPYVKAVTRDMRNYIKARGYRSIPVGYSAADVAENRQEMADFMNCGSDEERSDFFAFNDYSWCDPSSFQLSGWDQKVQNFSSYSIPLFLSEYGCIKGKRQWQEVSSLYSTAMTGVFSGGLVYEYSEEEGNAGYGLVNIQGATTISEKDDFTALQTAFSNTPNPDGDGGYRASGAASTCPKKSSTWDVSTNVLPTIPEPAKQYFTSGAGAGKGFTGGGSQDAGTPSSSTQSSGNSTSTKTGAATAVQVPALSLLPVFCGIVVIASSMVGGLLL